VTFVRPRFVLLAALCAALLGLAIPSWAAAAEFTVDGTGDGAKGAGGINCVAAGECTLRAAIEGANESSTGADTIKFDPTVFNGEPADTITPSLLPEVTTPTTIDGTGCNAGSAVPCLSGAGVEGFALLVVKAEESTVEHLSVTVPAGVVGIRAIGTGTAKPGVAILDNTVALTSTTSPSTGISTIGTNAGTGNLIEGNKIISAYGFNYSISLRSGPNRVLGNELLGSGCCQAGITIDLGAAGNQIGGDTEASENVIENFAGGAIWMLNSPTNSTHNEVRRNRGANGSNFIVGAATPVPSFATAVPSSASGTAEPGATVRVFRSEGEGEIAGFLGEAVADGSGNWKAAFTKVPVGTLVAATQTLAGATSSLSQPVATIVGPEEEKAEKEAAEKAARERQEKEAQEQREKEAKEKGSGGGSTGGGSSSPAPAPTSPAPSTPAPARPTVKITAGPKKSSTATSARFRFRATPAAGARFECRLDAAKWARCTSPRTYRKLKPGRHTFHVRAIAAGLTGAVTKYQFTVKG